MTESEDHGGAQEAEEADPGKRRCVVQTSPFPSSGTTRKSRERVSDPLLLSEHLGRGGVHGLQVKLEDG